MTTEADQHPTSGSPTTPGQPPQGQIQLIQQVRVLDAVTQMDQVNDVLVQNGKIQAIANPITDWPAEAEVISGQDKVLMPGLVDLYSHSGEPGYEDRETLASLLRAGRAGGFTRLGVLPTTEPAVDNPAMVEKLLSQRQALAAAEPNLPHLYPWGALTQAAQGQQMTELAELAQTPIVGFADGRSLQNPLLTQRLLEYLKPLNRPVALWPCDTTLRGNGVVRSGPFALIYGFVDDPALSETAALAALLETIAAVGTPVHLMRLSTARGVELVRRAKAEGLPITASVSWMHLIFSSRNLGSYDPNLRLAPPLGNPEDQEALIAGVKDGTLDAIAIDHRPHTYEDKTVGFPAAPPGAIGLDLAWGVLWDAFVSTGLWEPLTLVQALSTNPARLWVQTPPTLQPQQPAEMVLFAPAQSWAVTPQTLESLSHNTPWLGQTLKGRVIRTWA
ncbi:dihydroorotase [Leptolyngbya sp. BL0902]|uniref:dihydroorotase n=1 Tax=Leptolyngbya sp. BL0902 TaxID=1115757 RepID=UPI00193555A1|nr:dihydroorotase [Leptolyngbya sp. BL0902]QQE64734.1 dihydroorotase [Leptolyngbya sp. BL0902]